MENCVEIKERTNDKLAILVKGDLFLRTLFFMVFFSAALLIFSIFFYLKIDIYKWNPPTLMLATAFALTGGYLLIKLLFLLFYQSFGFEYIVEKISDDKAIFYKKMSFLHFPVRTIPEKLYLFDYPVNFLGKHGFIIYIFGGSSKETLIGSNFLMRLLYTLLNPPFMKVELRFNSYEETKEISKQILFEIKKLLKEEKKIISSPKKTPLMKIGLSPSDIQAIVKTGVDVNERDTILGNTAIFYAAGTDPEIPPEEWGEPNYSSIAELVRCGANVNAVNFYNERILDYYRRVRSLTTGTNPDFKKLKAFLVTYGYK